MIPIRRQEEREARERERIQNIEPEIDRSRRKTFGQIQAEFAKAGINIGERGRSVPSEDPEAVRIKLGLTVEEWNAIPNQPARLRNR